MPYITEFAMSVAYVLRRSVPAPLTFGTLPRRTRPKTGHIELTLMSSFHVHAPPPRLDRSRQLATTCSHSTVRPLSGPFSSIWVDGGLRAWSSCPTRITEDSDIAALCISHRQPH